MTFVALMLLGVMVALFGASMVTATYSDNPVDKYQALFVLTLSAGAIAFIAKLVVLLRNRVEHKLRVLEYIEHSVTTGVLAAGLTFGALALVIATMKDVASDPVSEEALQSAILYALLPMLLTFMAVFVTVSDFVQKIPCSREPSELEKDIVRAFLVIVRYVRLVINLARRNVRGR